MVCQETRGRPTIYCGRLGNDVRFNFSVGSVPTVAELDDGRARGHRSREMMMVCGCCWTFPSISPLTACEGCIRDHRWQSPQAAESNVRTADCGSIIQPKGAWCDELDGGVIGQIQHLCWIQEGDGHFGKVLCAGVTTSP